jgi:hypothetical protein
MQLTAARFKEDLELCALGVVAAADARSVRQQLRSAMQSKLRILQVAYLIALPACTAPWGRVVQYSSEPSHLSLLVEVYRTALASLVEGLTDEIRPDSVAMENFGYPARLDPPTSCGGLDVPEHWADTLKHEVRAALSDANCSKLADSADIVRAAQTVGLVLLPADTTDRRWNPKAAPPPRAKLSRPGFNRDSTIAAIRLDVSCGPLCGSGETLLLARKPGKRWRVWHSFLHWVS